MPNKDTPYQTLGEFLSSPFGVSDINVKNTAIQYEEKYKKLMQSARKIYCENWTESNGMYMIHMKIPSESQDGLYYDAVVQFFTDDDQLAKQNNLERYYIQFFSNSPSFIYKYAALYKVHGYLIDTLYEKMDPEYSNILPDKANPNYKLEYDKSIYYACGETIDKIDLLPQVEAAKEKGIDILYLTDYLDEFVFKVMMNYKEKNFVNVASEEADFESDEEKEELKKTNEEYKDMFTKMHDVLNNGVNEIAFTHRLKNHPVCLTSKGDVSVEMQKVMDAMPTDTGVKATTVMEINESHPIANKLKSLYEKKDYETLEKYSKILYAEARLIEGMSLDNPTEISNLISEELAK